MKLFRIIDKFKMKRNLQFWDRKNFLSIKEEDVNKDEDTNSAIKFGLIVLIFGFGGLILWASFAPLDEGVPCQGTVTIDTKRKVVQHLSGGIVSKVNVKEGDLVKAGDILLVLDKSMVQSRLQEIRQRYIGERALEGRLLAEQLGFSKIKFHEDLLVNLEDPLVSSHMKNQSLLLLSRRASLEAELQAIEEAIGGQKAQIEGLSGLIESRRVQSEILHDQINNISGLVEDGYAPRTQLRDLQIRDAQVTGDIADSQSGIFRAKKAIAELKQKSIAKKEEYRKEVETQMSQVRMEVDSDQDKLKALKEEFERTEIKSPVAGQVVGLQVQTIGSVIQPGQKILDVVPFGEGLLIEVKIAPHLIDRVVKGQSADVRFSTFAHSPLLSVEGIVESISTDLLLEPGLNPSQPGASYYLARISITRKGSEKLGGHVMQSGMPVQAVIKTGERSLLTYLMHPFIKRIAASFKEE